MHQSMHQLTRIPNPNQLSDLRRCQVKVSVPRLHQQNYVRSQAPQWRKRKRTNCFPSAFLMISAGTPLNCLR
ncbi:hypothetical protein AN958_04587 [Leucoagaricus sp. SymC.cos]|nr:hypothetical protein AN958_04587 [Leucoagaricus sp. SymC.cos]